MIQNIASKDYYLDPDFNREDASNDTCTYQNAYIDTALDDTYSLYTDQGPYEFELLIKQDQGVLFNLTVKYANGTAFDDTVAWFDIDYSLLSTGYVNITFDMASLSIGANTSELYELNLEVETLDSDYPVIEDKLIDFKITNAQLASNVVDVTVLVGETYSIDIDVFTLTDHSDLNLTCTHASLPQASCTHTASTDTLVIS